MIKGNMNKLELNEATMIEIVQQWLDREMRRAPKVTGFKSKIAGESPIFAVDLGEPKDEVEET